MMMDTTVYGWIQRDSSHIVCKECADIDYVPSILRDSEEWSPLYSLEDDGRGLSCDDNSDYHCTGWVFEPQEEYCPEHDDFHWTEEEWCDEYRANRTEAT